MFEELINKEVICSNIGILQFMYPNFKIISNKNEIIDDTPFIYIGSRVELKRIKESNIPHIIVSNVGDYDLDDREALLALAYKKHNMEVSEQYYALIKLDYNDFLYIWKHLWVLGELLPIVIDTENIFRGLLEFIDCPRLFIKKFLSICNTSNVKVIEKVLINFMIDSIKGTETNNKWLISRQRLFASLYAKNIKSALVRHFKQCQHLNCPILNLFLLLIDIIYGCNSENDISYTNYDYNLIQTGYPETLEPTIEQKEYLMKNLKSVKQNMTTIILGELGCRICMELYGDEIHFLKTLQDVKNFIEIYDYETDEVLVFGDLSSLPEIALGAFLKFIEEAKRPLIALCSKDDMSGAMMSRFMKKVKIEEKRFINEVPICQFIEMKKSAQRKMSIEGTTSRRNLYTKEERLINENIDKAYQQLCPMYWYYTEYANGNVTLLDDKIYLMHI